MYSQCIANLVTCIIYGETFYLNIFLVNSCTKIYGVRCGPLVIYSCFLWMVKIVYRRNGSRVGDILWRGMVSFYWFVELDGCER